MSLILLFKITVALLLLLGVYQLYRLLGILLKRSVERYRRRGPNPAQVASQHTAIDMQGPTLAEVLKDLEEEESAVPAESVLTAASTIIPVYRTDSEACSETASEWEEYTHAYSAVDAATSDVEWVETSDRAVMIDMKNGQLVTVASDEQFTHEVDASAGAAVEELQEDESQRTSPVTALLQQFLTEHTLADDIEIMVIRKRPPTAELQPLVATNDAADDTQLGALVATPTAMTLDPDAPTVGVQVSVNGGIVEVMKPSQLAVVAIHQDTPEWEDSTGYTEWQPDARWSLHTENERMPATSMDEAVEVVKQARAKTPADYIKLVPAATRIPRTGSDKTPESYQAEVA